MFMYNAQQTAKSYEIISCRSVFTFLRTVLLSF